MDRKQYFKDYYQSHSEYKKRKRRERYATKKATVKWGLFVISRYETEERRIKTYCGKHKNNYKPFIKRLRKLYTKVAIRRVEDGECASCKFEAFMKNYRGY